jgi:uncharacterized tellurite resistance protein B-like protein
MTARRERNAALIEAMLMVAAADGNVSQVEKETLLRRVIERPEFEGTRPEELHDLLRISVEKLSVAQDLNKVMASIRERLPDHRNRMLAFGLAAAIAFADRRATREELGLLKHFQAALGISEEEVAKIVDVVEQGGSLAEALGEPEQQLYAEVMVLVSASGGKVDSGEAQALVESLAGDPVFRDVSPSRAQGYVNDAVAALATEGLGRRVQVLARGLTTHAQRLKAYELAARVAKAKAGAPTTERRILDILQATFGLADDEVARILKES